MTNIIRREFLANLPLVGLLVMATPALAHEFWIDLERGRLPVGDTIVGDLKVGQMLIGQSYPFLSTRFRRFTVTNGDSTTRVTGNEGDIPALTHTTRQSGLHVVAQHTTDFRVTYDEWRVFHSYLEEEGLERFAEQHRTRGLPDTGFSERYTRCVKALVQVGAVTKSDHDIRAGMPFELVAEANPYAAGTEDLPVTLLWQGKPVENWQINVFRDAGTVTRTAATTDDYGRAVVALPGVGEYLLSAVYLQPADDGPVVWQSHWAALSFELAHDGG